MKRLDPNLTSHTITLVPRFDDIDFTCNLLLQDSQDLLLQNGNTLLLNAECLPIYIYNEGTRVEDLVDSQPSYVDGKLQVEFDYTVAEGETFQIKIVNGTEIVYRGKLIATEQETQDYQITKDHYTYG